MLGPLAFPATREMVAALRGATAHQNAKRIYRRTRGLPLAIEEFVTAQARGIQVDRHEDAYPLIGAVVREQLNEVSGNACLVMKLTALAPQPASVNALIRATSLSRDEVDTALDEVAGTSLIRRQGHHVEFRHDLHKDVLIDSLNEGERRTLHARLAEALMGDPSARAADIAHQLTEAGDAASAAEWFVIAADYSIEANDHGNALEHIRVGLNACKPDLHEISADLVERLPLVARQFGRAADALDLVDETTRWVRDPRSRGRVLFARNRLASQLGDFRARSDSLAAAREEFDAAGDIAGAARALGALALPLGDEPPIAERIRLGRQGLRLAEQTNEAATVALCAGNLAASELALARPVAFGLWRRAVHELDEAGDGARDETVSLRYNWAFGALAFGRYRLAERIIDDALRAADDPWRVRQLHKLRTVHLWRVGRWDDALAAARLARAGKSVPDVAIVDAIQTAIAFERSPRAPILPLVEAADALLGYDDYYWGSVAMATLARIRAARREPRPERGLVALASRISASGILVGWDDITAVAVELGNSAYQQITSSLGGAKPLGPRGEAATAYARGYSEGDVNALNDADERYSALGDPFMRARSLEAAAERLAGSRRAGESWATAARIYADLGAERSLARVLRRGRGIRALRGYQIPSGQRNGRAAGLTAREQEVADLARLGHTALEIAARLTISYSTACHHVSSIKAKLGAKRKSDLVRLLSD